MAEVFDIDSFIAGINQDKVQPKSSKDRLNRVLMNTRDNQGTLTFVPLFSKGAKNFYTKIQRVFEFYGDTSTIENGEGWFRVLPIEFYGDLTQEQLELYSEVKSYLEQINDDELLSYDQFRVRNYSLFYGMCLKLKNTEDKENTDIKDCPCLFVYPSPNPISQLCDAINAKVDLLKGSKTWLTRVLSMENTGRKGVVQVKFIKSDGPGYDCTVNFEMNNTDEGIIAIDPDYEISDETMKLFNDVIPSFLGWNYDRDNKQYFNETVFKELRDQLKIVIKTASAEVSTNTESQPENKNDLTPKDEAPKQRRPF